MSNTVGKIVFNGANHTPQWPHAVSAKPPVVACDGDERGAPREWARPEDIAPMLEARIAEAELEGASMIRLRVEHAKEIVAIFKRDIEIAAQIADMVKGMK